MFNHFSTSLSAVSVSDYEKGASSFWQLEEASGAPFVLVASISKKIIGVLKIEWGAETKDYWHYVLSQIDVHNDFREKGIGVRLIKELNDLDVLRYRVLRMPRVFTEMGAKYVKPVLERDLMPNKSCVIHGPICSTRATLPDSPGVYGVGG